MLIPQGFSSPEIVMELQQNMSAVAEAELSKMAAIAASDALMIRLV